MNTFYFIVFCAMLELSSIAGVSGMALNLNSYKMPPGNLGVCPAGSRQSPDGQCVPLFRDSINGGCSQQGGCKQKLLELPSGGCSIYGCISNYQDHQGLRCDGGWCPVGSHEPREVVGSCPAGHLRTQEGRCVPTSNYHRDLTPEVLSGRCDGGWCPHTQESIVRGCPEGHLRTLEGRCVPNYRQSTQYLGGSAGPVGYGGGCPAGGLLTPDGRCLLQRHVRTSGEGCSQNGGCSVKYSESLPGSCPDGRCLSDNNGYLSRVSYSGGCPAGSKPTQDGRCAPLYQQSFSNLCPAGTVRQDGRCAPKLRFLLKGGCIDGECPS